MGVGLVQEGFELGEELGRLGHAACALAIAGQQPYAGCSAVEPWVGLHLLPVALDRLLLPHVGVHGGGQQNGAGGGQDGVSEEVVGGAVGKLGQGIGRQRGNDHDLCPFTQLDMERSPLGGVPEVCVGEGGLATEGAEAEGRDKLLGRIREDGSYIDPGFAEG